MKISAKFLTCKATKIICNFGPHQHFKGISNTKIITDTVKDSDKKGHKNCCFGMTEIRNRPKKHQTRTMLKRTEKTVQLFHRCNASLPK